MLDLLVIIQQAVNGSAQLEAIGLKALVGLRAAMVVIIRKQANGLQLQQTDITLPLGDLYKEAQAVAITMDEEDGFQVLKVDSLHQGTVNGVKAPLRMVI